MGCDYYIYTALKIHHKNGVSLIKLKEEPVYLHGCHYDDDDFTTHPLKRRPKIDHMKPDYEDVLIYKKGELNNDLYLPKYMELIEELIQVNEELLKMDEDYEIKNKILRENYFFKHDSNTDCLKSMDDISEIFIAELRAWRNG